MYIFNPRMFRSNIFSELKKLDSELKKAESLYSDSEKNESSVIDNLVKEKLNEKTKRDRQEKYLKSLRIRISRKLSVLGFNDPIEFLDPESNETTSIKLSDSYQLSFSPSPKNEDHEIKLLEYLLKSNE